jgi:hypothetical protein
MTKDKANYFSFLLENQIFRKKKQVQPLQNILVVNLLLILQYAVDATTFLSHWNSVFNRKIIK